MIFFKFIKKQQDSDGFKIPKIPKRRIPPQFNAEDSFASSDDEQHRPLPPQEPKVIVKERSKKPVVAVKKTTTRKSKFNAPAFNAEDSFASSGDEDNDFELVGKKRVAHKNKREESVDTEIVNEDEEEDDADYNADTDDTDDDEDIGQVDKEELVLLYKDQAIPPEVFTSSEYCGATRHQTLVAAAERINIWKARLTRILYALCTLYVIFGSIGLVITSIARKNNGYCDNYPKEVNQTGKTVVVFYRHLFTKNLNVLLEPLALFSILPSSCIPCPDHGICKGGKLVCDTLYERKTPIYNLGHIFPIADDCVHNSVLGKYVGKVERHIKQKLAMEQGKATCEHLIAHPESRGEIPPTRVAIKDILADLNSSVKSHLPAERMEEILVIALSAVLEDPKIHYWET